VKYGATSEEVVGRLGASRFSAVVQGRPAGREARQVVDPFYSKRDAAFRWPF